MIERMEELFKEITGLTDIEFTPKTKFDKIENLSSLAMIQLICAIEDEFDISIPNTALKKFKTVGDVVKFLEKNAD